MTPVRRARFGMLVALAFGLVLASFVVMGLSRIVLPYRTARLLAAPFLLCGAALVGYLLVQSVLVTLGVRELDD